MNSNPGITMPLNAVFMGTPDFAAVILSRLLEFTGIRIRAIYTQPDRPAGRGNKLTPSSVKLVGLQHNIPVLQPENFKNQQDIQTLAAFQPDLLLVAAYGLLLPEAVLSVPRLMPVNVHTSLLPLYRGAAPVQRSILNGDLVTGVTIMRMDKGLDTGPILLQRAVGIGINDTTQSLQAELAVEGAELLLEALARISSGALACIAQDDQRASYAPKLTKNEGVLNFAGTAPVLHAQIRGVTPWPSATCYLERAEQPILACTVGPGVYPCSAQMLNAAEAFRLAEPHRLWLGAENSIAYPIGIVDGSLVLCGRECCYAVNEIRPSGKKSMSGLSFYNGYLKGHSSARFLGAYPSAKA